MDIDRFTCQSTTGRQVEAKREDGKWRVKHWPGLACFVEVEESHYPHYEAQWKLSQPDEGLTNIIVSILDGKVIMKTGRGEEWATITMSRDIALEVSELLSKTARLI